MESKEEKNITLDDIKNLIKENLEIKVKGKFNTDRYEKETYIQLVFCGEIISSTIIDDLTKEF